MNDDKEMVGIVKDEKTLYNAVDDLWQAGFDFHDISVQGDPEQIQAVMGRSYVDPTLLADNPRAPRKDPSMPEEFGWILAFSFAIPLFLGMILGSVFASGIYQAYFAILEGVLGGAILGAIIGLILAYTIKRRHDNQMQKQVNQGGFVIWVRGETDDKLLRAKMILQNDGAYKIHERIK